MKTPHPRYHLILEAGPTDDRPAVSRVRAMLKVCWRAWGLKCVEIRELREAERVTDHDLGEK